MNKQPRKGQTSLDFMMTYGWALLLVVVVVSSLFALGVFNAGSFMGPRATGFAQVGVLAWNVNAAGVLSLRLQNFAGMDINIINIEATYSTSHFPYDITNVSIPNGKVSDTFTVGAISNLAPGQYYTMPLRIIYTDINGFNYTETGTISGTVGAGAVPPMVRINSPHSNSVLDNRTINVSVSVWGNNLTYTDIMIIDSTGTPVNVTTNSQLGTYAVELSVADDGIYNVTALAHYSDGGSASATASNITVNVSVQLGPQCGDPLDIQDHVYTLTDDVSGGGTCFTIGADNVTLDCNGHSISGGGSDYGIDDSAGYAWVTVKNCVIANFLYGIYFAGGSHGTIENNTISLNNQAIALYAGSNDNTVVNNTAISNYHGAYLHSNSNSNTISNNTFSSNGYSNVYITSGSSNTISNNIITNSSYIGVWIDSSSNNNIYDNLFNNSLNFQGDGSPTYWNTTLDCGVPGANIIGGDCMGGNYWAQPDGYGFSQNCSTNGSSNSSGICTVPYGIDGSNVDELPLTTNFTAMRTAVGDSVWVANAGSNNVFRINKTTENTIGSPIPVVSDSYGVAVDQDYVWVTDNGGNAISRINKTDTDEVTTIYGVGSHPFGVAVDQDYVWVANNGGTVSRINKTDTSDITSISGFGSSVWGIAVDQDSVWATSGYDGSNIVSRINKSTNTNMINITVGLNPNGVAVDNDFVWVASDDPSGTISIINKTDTSDVTTITVGSHHEGIAIDQDSVWVANNWGDYGHTVSRINKTTRIGIIDIPVAPGPYGISIDQDSVWTSGGFSGDTGTLSRINKSTNTHIATISVGKYPYSLGDMTGYAYDMLSLWHTNLTPAPSCIQPPSGLVAWWPGDGNANDIIGGNDGTLIGDAAYVQGEVNQSFSLDGEGDGVGIPGSSLNMGESNFSISAWIRAFPTMQSNEVIFEKRALGYPYTGYVFYIAQSGITLGFETNNATNMLDVEPGLGYDLRDGNWHHVAASADRTSPNGLNIYLDGADIGTIDISHLTGSIDNTEDAAIGKSSDAYLPNDNSFNGTIDELQVYDRALNASEIQAIYDAGSAGMCKNVSPQANLSVSITSPANNSILDTRTVTVNLTVSGTGLNYTNVSIWEERRAVDSYLLVPNAAEGTISVIDKASGTVVNTTTVESAWCIGNIAVDPDYAWVTDNCAGGILKIDKTNYTVVDTISGITSPASVAADDRHVWVCTGNTEVVEIDKRDDSIVSRIPLPFWDCNGIAVDAESVWVTGYRNGEVTKIDKATGTIMNTTGYLGWGTSGIVLDEGFAWVIQTDASLVYKFNKSTAAQVDVIDIGGGASNLFGVATDRDSVWISSYIYHSVVRINKSTDLVQVMVPVSSMVNGASIAVDDDNVWTANIVSNTVSKIDKTAEAVVDDIPVGSYASINGDATGYKYDMFFSRVLVNSTTTSASGDVSVSLDVPSNGVYDITATVYDTLDNSASDTVGNITINTTGALGCVQPPSGLISWWPGDGNASDIIGGNNGGWNGTESYSAGKVSQAFSFDGNSAVYAPSPFPTPSTGTVSVWIHKEDESYYTDTVFDLDRDIPGGVRIMDDGSSGLGFYTNSQSELLAVIPGPSLNEWHHIVITWDGQTKRMYIDGVENASASSTALAQSSRNLAIGNLWEIDLSHLDWYAFNGLIDEVQIYGRALNASEVQAIYNASSYGVCRPTAPQPTGLSDCGNISYSGNYILTSNVSNSDTCFTIEADNVTLDCNGHSITGDDSGDGIDNTNGNSYLTARNCEVTGFSTGIDLMSNTGNVIENNTVNSNYYGIYLGDSSGNTVANNTASSNGQDGISLYSSPYNSVINNTVHDNQGNGYGGGIFLESDSDHNIIADNDASSNADIGILLVASSGNVIANNTVDSTGAGYGNGDGIYLYSGSDGNSITNNTARSNSNYGIHLSSSSSNSISSNNASSNVQFGIWFVSGSNYNNISNNTASSNVNAGVLLQSSSSNTFANNELNSNVIGIDLATNSNNNIVVGNTANLNSHDGFVMENNADYNTIANNTASLNDRYGIDIVPGSYNIVYNNFFNNTDNVYVQGTSNLWNTTLDCGTTNIISGPCIGGNFWAQPDGNGWSENSTECGANESGLCTSPYGIPSSSDVDELPLTNLTPQAHLAMDGTVWVANLGSNDVYRINGTTGLVIGSPITVGSAPIGVAVDPDSVWVTNMYAVPGTVSRIDKSTNTVIANITVGSNPYGIAADQDSVWVANTGSASVSWINKSTNTVIANITVGSGPDSISVDQDSIWVTHNAATHIVDRINKTTGLPIGSPITLVSWLRGVAVDNDSVWVANCEGGGNAVSRINKSTDTDMIDIPVGSYPWGIAADQDSVWVANANSNAVSRINKSTNTVIGSPIPVGASPRGIAVDGDSVWVANSGAGTVSRINETTGDVIGSPITVGSSPYNVGDATGYSYDRFFH